MSAAAAPPLPGKKPGGRPADLFWLLLCIAGTGWFSLRRGQDANWDLQNYHFYNPWAWVHGKRGYTFDIAAAQLQTYHSPIPDLPFYWMVAAGWSPRAIAFVLAVPAGVAAFVLLKLLNLLFADLPPRERGFAVGIAFVVSATSAMGAGVLGTTMNEWPGALLVLTGLWVIVRAMVRGGGAPLPGGALAGAGLLCGLAAGLKLTFGLFAFALCLALWLRQLRPFATWLRHFREAFLFGLAVLAGTAIAGGPWLWALWSQLDNPVFPYANVWIKSPWWGQYEVMGRPYGPHRLIEWIEFPFRMLSPKPFFVAETDYRDGRFPVLYGLALAALAAWLARRLRVRGVGAPVAPAVAGPFSAKAWRLVALFFLFAFVLWTEQFSIYRYLVPLEMLSGALIVALLYYLLRPGYALPAAAVLAAVLVASTKAPDWWHLEFENRTAWFDVKVPPVEPGALVLLTSDAPMGYVLPFFPKDARFFGINNSINDPKRDTLMAKTIVDAIKAHGGPIYSLTYPKDTGVDELLAHNLLRLSETCRDVVTDMRTSPIQLCRLFKIPPKS
ncbi:MAG: hypothetical protein IT522_10590 [Burkholderiales bacterium]|nr:hypothetical protein [Burkholderiales bacterium]